MCLLLVKSIALGTGVGPETEMHVIPMTAQAIGKVKHLVTIGAGMTALIQMRGDKMLGAVTFLCKRLSTLLAFKLLDFQMHDTMVLARRRRVAEHAVTKLALDILASPPLRNPLLRTHTSVRLCVRLRACGQARTLRGMRHGGQTGRRGGTARGRAGGSQQAGGIE